MTDHSHIDKVPSSAASFSAFGLEEQLLRNLRQQGISDANEVQQQVIPATLGGHDLLVQAETGSGKTLAYLLPLADCLLKADRQTRRRYIGATRALVLVPTRELARQVLKQCQRLLKSTHLLSCMLCGGQEFKYQQALLRKTPDLLIATPGRLLEHLALKSLDLSQLEYLVLDEADRMLDLGLQEDVLRLLAFLNHRRQSLLFSATLQLKGLPEITSTFKANAERLLLSSERAIHQHIQQQYVLADNDEHKFRLLEWLLQHEHYDKALVFFNTRARVEHYNGEMRNRRFLCSTLHGEMSQEERNAVIDHYRQGRIRVLCASDLAARGLDIEGIDLVVNFDMTTNSADYIHRIGRTGRAGRQGLAIALICSTELGQLYSIERHFGTSLQCREIAALKGKKQRAGVDGRSSSEQQQSPWRRKQGPRRKPPAQSRDGFSPLQKKKPRS